MRPDPDGQKKEGCGDRAGRKVALDQGRPYMEEQSVDQRQRQEPQAYLG